MITEHRVRSYRVQKVVDWLRALGVSVEVDYGTFRNEMPEFSAFTHYLMKVDWSPAEYLRHHEDLDQRACGGDFSDYVAEFLDSALRSG